MEKRDLQTERSVVETLPRLGRDAAAAVPSLVRFFHEVRNRNPQESTNELSGVLAASKIARSAVSQTRPPMSYLRVWPEEVLDALGLIGPAAAEAIPLLADEYSNRTNRVRLRAAMARWQIDRAATEVLPVLSEEFNAADWGTRRWIVDILGEIGAEALPALRTALRDPDSRIREHVITTMAKSPLDPAIVQTFYEQALDDTDTDGHRSKRLPPNMETPSQWIPVVFSI